MREFKLPTTCGRSVLLRGCVDTEAIQFGIVGKRGGLVEGVAFDATQLPGLLGYLTTAQEELEAEAVERAKARDASLLDLLADAKARANATHCEQGHELTKANSFTQGSGKGCRTCRRESNFWVQKEQR